MATKNAVFMRSVVFYKCLIIIIFERGQEVSENLKIQSRISWIDIAKGYGILFVIFAHLGMGMIKGWIYTFHMPLFFFYLGMCLV